jgi:hypothetical protein
MAESKFTPGPWRVEKSAHFQNTYRVWARDVFLCAAVGWLESGNGTTPEETKANAELMADAPRLLEVLDTLYDCVDHEKLLPSQLDAYHRARELLAKHGG